MRLKLCFVWLAFLAIVVFLYHVFYYGEQVR